MKRIEKISGILAPLMVDNISTDIISPSILLQSVTADLAAGLFGPWRYLEGRTENPDFVLNQPRFRGARVLVLGNNFGCGSSREHAVWCLQRYGIECVIAPSFGDIFFESSFKNGLVALTLPENEIADLAQQALQFENSIIDIDIKSLTMTVPNGDVRPFALERNRRAALLEGLEEIDIILRRRDEIETFQAQARRARPWLFPSREAVAARLREAQ